MVNKDGSHGSKATARELCECYAEPMLKALSRMHEVPAENERFYLQLLVQDATIAAHHGRRALRQSKLK